MTRHVERLLEFVSLLAGSREALMLCAQAPEAVCSQLCHYGLYFGATSPLDHFRHRVHNVCASCAVPTQEAMQGVLVRMIANDGGDEGWVVKGIARTWHVDCASVTSIQMAALVAGSRLVRAVAGYGHCGCCVVLRRGRADSLPISWGIDAVMAIAATCTVVRMAQDVGRCGRSGGASRLESHYGVVGRGPCMPHIMDVAGTMH